MRTTKAELAQSLAQLAAENEALRLKLSTVTAERDMFARTAHNAIARNDGVHPVMGERAKPVPRTGARTVYEFNPNVAGDFKRAADLAKANGGLVRRAA
jgi:hypothetical protein